MLWRDKKKVQTEQNDPMRKMLCSSIESVPSEAQYQYRGIEFMRCIRKPRLRKYKGVKVQCEQWKNWCTWRIQGKKKRRKLLNQPHFIIMNLIISHECEEKIINVRNQQCRSDTDRFKCWIRLHSANLNLRKKKLRRKKNPFSAVSVDALVAEVNRISYMYIAAFQHVKPFYLAQYEPTMVVCFMSVW